MAPPRLASWLAVCTLARTAVAIKCGVVIGDHAPCPYCLEAAQKTCKMDFWWNWKASPDLDFGLLDPLCAALIRSRFVPMLWGQAKPPDYGFLNKYMAVMGYNEPDLYGPPCLPWLKKPNWGCMRGETRSAVSSGWAPLFDPSVRTGGQPRAALLWQWTVNNMTTGQPPRTGGVKRLLSPAMALNAIGKDSCVGMDPAMPGAVKRCQGWLKVFKENALQLPCTDFQGRKTNCWDAIDVIQIHGYGRCALDVKIKIKVYHEVFKEDFEGLNGRKKKTMWLTEVAPARRTVEEALIFMHELMNPIDGLSNKGCYPYLEKVSWFSVKRGRSFPLDTYTPTADEVWYSSLFDDNGGLSRLGRLYFTYCEEVNPLETASLLKLQRTTLPLLL